MLLDFAAKKTKKKGKKKNCKKGYPCGYSCIEKTRNCRAKLKEQSGTYAGWLKKQATKPEISNAEKETIATKNTKDKGVLKDDPVSQMFSKEVGDRLGREAGKLWEKKGVTDKLNDLIDYLDTTETDLLKTDRGMLKNIKGLLEDEVEIVNRLTSKKKTKKLTKVEQEQLELGQKLIKQYSRNQEDIEKGIAKRQAKIDKKIPKNTINKFNRLDDVDRAWLKYNKGKKSPLDLLDEMDKLQSYLDEEDAENNIKRFKRPRNFSESKDPVKRYLARRSRILEIIDLFRGFLVDKI